MTRMLPTLLTTLALCGAATAAETAPFQHGEWTVLDTANFRVCVTSGEAEVRELADACEAVRQGLCGKWLGNEAHPTWGVRCHVVLHPTSKSYLREVGPAQATAGASLLEMKGDEVVTRRIDLRADHAEGFAGALAHELTHVVVAERFIRRAIPRWADEGMAVLADSTVKQMGHYNDLLHARKQGRQFRTVELLTLDDYPEASRTATFYAQSASLVQFLIERGTPAKFLEFVELSTVHGHDAALTKVYGLSGIAELERLWLRHVASPAGCFVADHFTGRATKKALAGG